MSDNESTTLALSRAYHWESTRPDALINGSSGKSELDEALHAHLASVNQSLEDHEVLSFAAVVKDKWLIENGFLTPTMKIKRNVIEEVYSPQAESWYQDGSPIIWQ